MPSYTRTPLLPLCLLLLSLALSACDKGSTPASGPTLRDSAGIQIVENTAPQWPHGRGWRLADQPLMDIGALQGDADYQLFRVAGAQRLSDGRIVVANSGTSELRFYDAAGRFLSKSGRRGGGPGELEGLLSIGVLPNDSVMAYDWRYRRVSVFDSAGRFTRSFDLRFIDQAGGLLTVAAPFPDHTLLLGLEQTFVGERQPGRLRDTTLYLHCDMRGALLDTIGRFPGGESYSFMEGDTWVGGGRVFGRLGQAAVQGAGFYYGSSDSYEIGYYTANRTLQRLIRLDQPNLEVTPEDIERYTQQSLARARDERRRQIRERMFARMPWPETMPAYDEFIADAEGNLWVAEYRRPGDEQPRWKVFGTNGALLGTVEMPPRFRVYQIGSDFVLGRWSDDLEVEHVQLYELVKE